MIVSVANKRLYIFPNKINTIKHRGLEIHNGVAVTDFTYSGLTGKVQFYTSSFSPFEITYSEVEGACVTLSSDQLDCYALSLNRLRRQLPPGGSLTSFFLLPI